MMKQIEERTIALAGVLQACAQVQAIARTGELNEAVSEAAISSILILDAVNTPAVYGGLGGVEVGLAMVRDGAMQSASPDNAEVIRYAMSLLHLQSQLYRDDDAFQRFGQAVEQLSRYSGEELIEQCSEVYKEHISRMRPQIIVQGEQGYLQRPDVPPQVRALLLAGVRSAVLWQQKGGNRLKLLWERGKYRSVAEQLLHHQQTGEE